MIYLWTGYLVTWAALALFVRRLSRREREAARALEAMERDR